MPFSSGGSGKSGLAEWRAAIVAIGVCRLDLLGFLLKRALAQLGMNQSPVARHAAAGGTDGDCDLVSRRRSDLTHLVNEPQVVGGAGRMEDDVLADLLEG